MRVLARLPGSSLVEGQQSTRTDKHILLAPHPEDWYLRINRGERPRAVAELLHDISRRWINSGKPARDSGGS